MLIPEYSEEDLLKFYHLDTLEPTTKQQLNLTSQEFIDADEILKLPEEDQFHILNQLVNSEAIVGISQLHQDPDVSNGVLEDPLRGNNIMKDLQKKHIIKSSNDPEVNSYLISSQKFNSLKFLTNVHADSSIEQLSQSLNYLERNIRSQTNELIGAIDSNFVDFINCKGAIDDILEEFKHSKTKVQQEYENSRVFNPNQRQPAKNASDNSLSSELEAAIKNLNYTTSRMIQPVIENKNKEHKLTKLIDFIKANQFFFDLPSTLIQHLSNHNHDQFITDYNKFLQEKQTFIMARNSSYQRELTRLTNNSDEAGIKSLKQETDMITTAINKVFSEVDNITQQYRKKTYQELLSLDHEVANGSKSAVAGNDKFLALVETIHSLESEADSTKENPVYEFLVAQLANIDKELDHQIAKFDSKFRMMQLKLLDSITIDASRKDGSHIRYIAEKYYTAKSGIIASKQSSATKNNSNDSEIKFIMDIFNNTDNLDLSLVNETWLVLNNFIGYLDDLFLKNLSKFVNNYSHYYRLNNIDSKGKIRNNFINLINKVSLVLVTLFENDSGDTATSGDVNNQLESSPSNYKLFLPHYTNSLSTIYYITNINSKLNKFFTNLGEFTGLVGNLSKYNDTSKIIKSLKTSSLKSNQRLIEAVCATWINDCSQFYELQDWKTESGDNVDDNYSNEDGAIYTSMMHIIEYYQTFILTKLGQLIFLKEDTSSEFRIVQAYPSKRILMSIEIQFMRSLNILIDSIMKKYNIERNLIENNGVGSETATTPSGGSKILNEAFKVLTMNDLEKLSRITYPKLIKKFDEIFQNNLQNQKLKLFADIDKAHITIFDDIITREKLLISNEINLYFQNPNRPSKTGHPQQQQQLHIDGFIFLILIHFVKLIKKVKPITGLSVFLSIINELQSTVLKSILDNLRTTTTTTTTNSNLNSFELIKLKLDVNFFFKIFDKSQKLRFNDSNFKVLEILINSIDDKYNELQQDGHQDSYNYTDKEFRSILNENLRTSEHEFDCF